MASVQKYRYHEFYFFAIIDEEMNVAVWRQFGKSTKTSTAIKTLVLQTEGGFQGITPEIARCLQAFFEEVKENKTIDHFNLDANICTVIPAWNLRYFFNNNDMLNSISLNTERGMVSLAQSTHLSAALRDLSLNNVNIECNGFTNNGAFEQILFACQKMKKMEFNRLSSIDQYSSTAEWLQNPMTMLQKLSLYVSNFTNSNDDIERIENELLSSLAQNANLTSFKVRKFLSRGFLFRSDGSNERIKQLLCNTASIESILQSNHCLQEFFIQHREPEDEYQQYLEINKNPNKIKVVQTKIMQFYFSGEFDASSIANMPLSVLAHVIGIDVEKKQSSIFNILKSVPELCAVSSRSGGEAKLQNSLSDGSERDKKRVKI